MAQALSNGIFALFRAPIANEDHLQRALYTALLMQEESLYLNCHGDIIAFATPISHIILR